MCPCMYIYICVGSVSSVIIIDCSFQRREPRYRTPFYEENPSDNMRLRLMNENGEGAEAPQAGRLRSQRSRGFFSQPRGGSFLVLDVTDTIFSLSPIRLLESLCAFSCLNHLSEESHVDSRARRCNCRNIASRSSYVGSLLRVIEGLMIIDSSFSNIVTNYLEARKKTALAPGLEIPRWMR